LAKKKKRKGKRLTWHGGLEDEDLSGIEDGVRGEENEREDREKVDRERREEEDEERKIKGGKREEVNKKNKTLLTNEIRDSHLLFWAFYQ